MNNNDLIKLIKDNYYIECDNNAYIRKLSGYPHVFSLKTDKYGFIIKLIESSKLYCKNIDNFYSNLQYNEYILIPIKTKNNKFSVEYNSKKILMYDELQNFTIGPDPEWWAECLQNIHSSSIDNNFIKCTNNIYTETSNLLNEVYGYMDDDIKFRVDSIFKKIDLKYLNIDNNLVLCHRDPYDNNVLLSKDSYRIIDTDGMGLSQKEYDIQRLLYNYANSYDDINKLISFWETFKNRYEQLSKNKIDIEVLRNIYSCDLIRSLTWLFLVTGDENREDYVRQNEQLKLYKKSIRNDIHRLFINNM